MTTLTTVTITVALDVPLDASPGVPLTVPLEMVVISGVDKGSVDISPGQCSSGVLELTEHTLDTVRGRN